MRGFILNGYYRIALKPGYREWFSKRGISFGQIDLSLSRELLGLTPGGYSMKMCCSIDGKRLIVRSGIRQLSVLSTETWECLSKFDLPEDSSFTALIALPDGRIASGSDDGSISILLFEGDVLTLQMTLFDEDDGSDDYLYEDMPRRRGVTSLCLNHGGFLIIGDGESTLKVFSISAPSTAAESQPNSFRHSIACFINGDEFGGDFKSLILLKSGLVASCEGATIDLWKTSKGVQVVGGIGYQHQIGGAPVSGICLMDDGVTIAAAYDKGFNGGADVVFFWTVNCKRTDLYKRRSAPSSSTTTTAAPPSPSRSLHANTYGSLIPLMDDDRFININNDSTRILSHYGGEGICIRSIEGISPAKCATILYHGYQKSPETAPYLVTCSSTDEILITSLDPKYDDEYGSINDDEVVHEELNTEEVEIDGNEA